jgi:hypothetical protein
MSDQKTVIRNVCGLPAKIRGQRISESELIREAQAALIEAGIPNRQRAKYIRNLTRVVVGNGTPVLAQLQPKTGRPKHHFLSRLDPGFSPAWIRAYQFVAAYLNENGLKLTRQTVATEFPALEGTIQSPQSGPQELISYYATPRAFEVYVDRFLKSLEPKVRVIEVPPPIEIPNRRKKGRGKASPSPRSGRVSPVKKTPGT